MFYWNSNSNNPEFFLSKFKFADNYVKAEKDNCGSKLKSAEKYYCVPVIWKFLQNINMILATLFENLFFKYPLIPDKCFQTDTRIYVEH